MKFASGRNAKGQCARSGRVMYLRDMVEDTRTGLLVDPSWAERKDPIPPVFEDGIALRKAAPLTDRIATAVYLPCFDVFQETAPQPFAITLEMGRVTAVAT